MRTIRHLVSLIGTAVVLVSLCGCLTLSAAYRGSPDEQGYPPSQGSPYSWGYPAYPDYPWSREYRPYRGPRGDLPDRYTIHKGKKCEIQCERIWGTRDYQCREYRC